VIENQVHSNAFACLPQYGQSDYGFPIRRHPSIFIDVAMWEHRTFDSLRFLDVAKCTNLAPLPLLISCKLSFPIVGLKIPSLPYFGIEIC
jgi:hypothetical protein